MPLDAPPLPEPEPDELGLLGTIGDILDRPGNAFRGLLTGRADPLLGLIPFSETLGLYDPRENRVSGADVNRELFGLEHDPNDGILSGSGMAGLATEIMADPLNLLPGFLGLKAATKAGVATGKVAGHLDNAARLMDDAERAARTAFQKSQAGVFSGADDVLRAAPKPAASHPLFGNLFNEAGERFSDRQLVELLASQPDNVLGQSAKEVLENITARGLGDEALRVSSEAGERVGAGHEALLQVGGPWQPLLFGGPTINLPQKTLIEGAGAAQGIQDAWRALTHNRVVDPFRALFDKAPAGVAPAAAKVILEAQGQAANEIARGTNEAAQQAEQLLQKLNNPLNNPQQAAGGAANPLLPEAVLKELEHPFMPPAPAGPGAAAALDPRDSLEDLFIPGPIPTGPKQPENWMKMPELNDEMKAMNAGETSSMPANWDVIKYPVDAFPKGAEPIEGLRVTPLEDVTGRPKMEDFETVKVGSQVKFKPVNAIENPQGLHKQQQGAVEQIFTFNGRQVAQIGDWVVPVDAITRTQKNVTKDFQYALDQYEKARAFEGLKKSEQKTVTARAQDFRDAMRHQVPTGETPWGIGQNAEVKQKYNALLEGLGFKEQGLKEQVQGLAKAIESGLNAGQLPQFKTIDFVSMEAGTIGVGDRIPIGTSIE